MNQKKNSIPPQTFESPHQQAILTPPNPPTPEMIERAQVRRQDVQVEWEVSLIFDIETDGLLENVTTIHCLVIHDLETKTNVSRTTTQEIKSRFREAIQRLNDADCIIGHNILSVTTYLFSINSFLGLIEPYVVDTLLLSRLYHSDMMKLDKKHNWKSMPLQLVWSSFP